MGQAAEGLIPAHAGKTCEGVEMLGQARAHPRSRGENITPRPRVVRVKGSSPLTRGKLPRALTDLQAAGAHPRSRGENRDT